MSSAPSVPIVRKDETSPESKATDSGMSHADDNEEALANKYGLYSKQESVSSIRRNPRGGYRRGGRGRGGRSQYGAASRAPPGSYYTPEGVLMVPGYYQYQYIVPVSDAAPATAETQAGQPLLTSTVEMKSPEELLQSQLEYYFSQANLIKDLFLRSRMDDKGYVKLDVIASFNRVRMLTDNPEVVSQIAKQSSVLKVKGGKLRKRHEWWKWVYPPKVEAPEESSDEDDNRTPNAEVTISSSSSDAGMSVSSELAVGESVADEDTSSGHINSDSAKPRDDSTSAVQSNDAIPTVKPCVNRNVEMVKARSS